MQLNSFNKSIVLLALILIVGIYTLNNFGIIDLPNVLYYVVVAIAAFTYFAYQHLLKVKPKMFVNSFMGIIGIKMFASLVFLLIYIYLDPTQKYEVAFGLFAIYMVFNILLFTSIKKINPKRDVA